MAKTIKLEDQTYQELEKLQLRRETFSQTVDRLVDLYKKLSTMVWDFSTHQPPRPPQ